MTALNERILRSKINNKTKGTRRKKSAHLTGDSIPIRFSVMITYFFFTIY